MSDSDMSGVIIPKSDQINADDLLSGEITITIRDVKISGGQEQPVSIYFDGSEKAFRPCKSMSRVLVAAWGPDAKKYVGRSLRLYRDPAVKWGGLQVGGIRIRAMSHIEREMTMALTETRQSRKPFTVKPLGDTPATEPKPTSNIAEIRQQLSAAAEQGTVALREAWGKLPWNDLPPGIQDALTSEFADFKETATKADKQAADQPTETDLTGGGADPAPAPPAQGVAGK